MCRAFGPVFGPGDVVQGTLLACAEAISSGITTMHDWCHNVRGPEHAFAGLGALAQAGLRARFSYGYPAAHPNDQPMDLAGLRRLHAGWDGRGLLSLPAAVYRPEFDTARELGIPVTGDGCVLKDCGVLTTLDAGRIGADARQARPGYRPVAVRAALSCAGRASVW